MSTRRRQPRASRASTPAIASAQSSQQEPGSSGLSQEQPLLDASLTPSASLEVANTRELGGAVVNGHARVGNVHLV